MNYKEREINAQQQHFVNTLRAGPLTTRCIRDRRYMSSRERSYSKRKTHS